MSKTITAVFYEHKRLYDSDKTESLIIDLGEQQSWDFLIQSWKQRYDNLPEKLKIIETSKRAELLKYFYQIYLRRSYMDLDWTPKLPPVHIDCKWEKIIEANWENIVNGSDHTNNLKKLAKSVNIPENDLETWKNEVKYYHYIENVEYYTYDGTGIIKEEDNPNYLYWDGSGISQYEEDTPYLIMYINTLFTKYKIYSDGTIRNVHTNNIYYKEYSNDIDNNGNNTKWFIKIKKKIIYNTEIESFLQKMIDNYIETTDNYKELTIYDINILAKFFNLTIPVIDDGAVIELDN